MKDFLLDITIKILHHQGGYFSFLFKGTYE